MRDELAEKWLNSKVSNVVGRSVQGVALQFVSGILMLASVLILARMIPPKDYGVIAGLAPIVALVQMLKGMGLSATIIQATELDDNEVSAYFWIQVTLGLALGAGLALMGPLWAQFFEDDRLIPLAVAMGLIVFIQVLGGVHDALIRRNLLFGALTKIQCISLFAGLVVAVVAAYFGARYWSLVFQQLTVAVLTVFGLWTVCPWKPSRTLSSLKDFHGVFLGGSLTIGQLFEYLRRNIDLVLVRKFAGEEQLGFYSRGYRLVLLPTFQIMGPVMAIALPMLSRKKNDSDYNTAFEAIFRFCIAVAVPAGVFTLVFPEAVVMIGLGEQWLEATPIVRGLGLLGVFIPIGNCLSVNLIVFKQTKAVFFTSISALVIAIVAYGVGIRESVAALATYYGWSMAIMVLIYCFIVAKISPLSTYRLLKVAFPLILAMFLCGLTTKFASTKIGLDSRIWSALLEFVLFILMYGATLIGVLGYGKYIKEILGMFAQSNPTP